MTVLVLALSVALVVMLIVVPWLMAIPVGLRLSILGALSSPMANVVVMVLLLLERAPAAYVSGANFLS